MCGRTEELPGSVDRPPVQIVPEGWLAITAQTEVCDRVECHAAGERYVARLEVWLAQRLLWEAHNPRPAPPWPMVGEVE